MAELNQRIEVLRGEIERLLDNVNQEFARAQSCRAEAIRSKEELGREAAVSRRLRDRCSDLNALVDRETVRGNTLNRQRCALQRQFDEVAAADAAKHALLCAVAKAGGEVCLCCHGTTFELSPLFFASDVNPSESDIQVWAAEREDREACPSPNCYGGWELVS